MLAKNVLIRPQNGDSVTISWTSDSPETISWIFINGRFVLGPFMAETVDRAVTLPVPADKTFVVEVHDFADLDEIPLPIEEKALVKPQIAWNSIGHFEDTVYRYGVQQDREQRDHLAGYSSGAEAPINSHPRWVETATMYRIYHTIFDAGQRAVASQLAPGYAVASETTSNGQYTVTSLLLHVPPMGVERMDIDCPVTLEGRGGSWHSFRVESVDQFGNESTNEVVPYFAADLPPIPELSISRDVETGTLMMRLQAPGSRRQGNII